MIPPGYRNSQLQSQPQFPRSGKPGVTPHSTGKRWAQTLLSNEKQVGGDKSTFFSPLKHRTATEQQQLQQNGALKPPSNSHPQQPFPFLFCVQGVPHISSDFTNLTESNCPIPKHFHLPVRTPQPHTHIHNKLIQLHNHHFSDIIFKTSIS